MELQVGQKKEGSWWRPRLSETMKGAIPAIQLWGAGRKHRSKDSRIGQPHRTSDEFINQKEATW